VQNVSVDGRFRESDRESDCSGVSEDAGVRVGVSGNQAGRGGVCSGGKSHRSASTSKPLNSSTSQHLLATFLIRCAGSGEGAGGDSGDEGSGGGGSGSGDSGQVCGGATRAGGKEA
jgi:hypothetical protein